MNKFWGSNYSMTAMVNYTVLYTWKLLWAEVLKVLITKVTEVMDILTNIIVLIVSKYIYKILMLYTLNLHNALGQLSLFLAALCVMWEVSSPNRGQTQDPCRGSWVLTTGLPGKSPINYIWRKLGTSKQKQMSSVKLFIQASYEDVRALYSCEAWRYFRIGAAGTSLWPSGLDSAFALQGLWVWFLIRN